MRITRVETVELRERTVVHVGSVGWVWVRIHTDEGLVGLGETFPATPSEKAIVLNDNHPNLAGIVLYDDVNDLPRWRSEPQPGDEDSPPAAGSEGSQE
jgi:L-alanine-DL-glutamate epimerase-like enolase superfamily enzyme